MEEKKKNKTTKKKTNHLFSQRGSSVTPWTYNPIVSQLWEHMRNDEHLWDSFFLWKWCPITDNDIHV